MAAKVEAGPELDAQMAKLMGWDVHRDNCIPAEYQLPLYVGGDVTFQGCPFSWRAWSPSADITAAWEVLEKMASAGWSYIVGRDQAWGSMADFCRFWRHADPPQPDGKRKDVFTEHDVTVPLAICRAALKVVEKTNGG